MSGLSRTVAAMKWTVRTRPRTLAPMDTTYTKLFHTILSSSIWGEDIETKVVWITMLAMTDRYGEVAGSIPGLARLAGVSTEACGRAVERLLAPDPYSRTQDHEGRRLELVDGGWRLLNHAKYRRIASKEEQRERDRERKRRERASKA